jgi:hypothetical protein
MSAWEYRGFERSVRLRIYRQMLAWNKPLDCSLTEHTRDWIPDAICRQNPNVSREDAVKAFEAWRDAAADFEEGTAEYGKRLANE